MFNERSYSMIQLLLDIYFYMYSIEILDLNYMH